MRVAVYYSNQDVRLEEQPTPKIGPGELLVRVEACGICGSDVMEWYRRDRVPLVLGHEIAGVVEAVGEGVAAFRPGDRVIVAHHVPCLTCHYCLSGHPTVCDTLRRTNIDPGGFAEFIRVPAINVERGVWPLSPGVSFEEGTFVEPLACVLRGQRLARLRPGQSVLVLGSGITGLLHVQLARALGAGTVVATDVVDYRLRLAQRLGADAGIHAAADVPGLLRQVNDGRLADLVVLCTGAMPAIGQALRSVERGGTVLFFAPTLPGETVPLSVNDLFWRSEVTLTSSYAASPADHVTALELIRSRRVQVGEMVTHRLGLAQTGLGIHLVAEAGESVKVIIQPRR
ncbi:MAG: alcohol dehydrogenase catalytic domain-containing protein [Chloroflexi bacterium]|nr:alcohol dehydrogenase catalytic domain-containing protein [Chloroflexota bacterium]